MDLEWEIHHLNVKIDEIVRMIQKEIEFSEYVSETNHGKIKLHYHRNPRTRCTDEMVKNYGSCAGPSPHALLKKALQEALDSLNKTYPTSPLNEID